MQGPNNLHEYTGLSALETLTLTRAEREEWVTTPLDYSLILDYKVLCDDPIYFGIYLYMDKSLVAKESKNYTDMLISVHALAF